MSRNNRRRLTEAVIQSLRYPESGQYFVRDSVDIGLAVRLTVNIKAFVFESMAKGRMHRLKLGYADDGSMTLAQARRKARQFKAAIAAERDPFAEIQTARRAERQALTFGELARKFIEDHARARCKSAPRMEQRLERHFGRWASTRLADITPGACAKAHARIATESGPVAANRALQLLRSVFNKAIAWGDFEGKNPVTGQAVSFFSEDDPRAAVLTAEEEHRVDAEIDREPDWRWQSFFRLLRKLPLRKSELLGLRWSNVSLYPAAEASITLLGSRRKTGRTQVLPLVDDALREFSRLDNERDGRGDSKKVGWVFPSNGKTGHLVEAKAAWNRIRTRAGVEHVTIHDLRRTVATETRKHSDLATVSKMLGHQRISTTQRYLRVSNEDVRMALERNAQLTTASR